MEKNLTLTLKGSDARHKELLQMIKKSNKMIIFLETKTETIIIKNGKFYKIDISKL